MSLKVKINGQWVLQKTKMHWAEKGLMEKVKNVFFDDQAGICSVEFLDGRIETLTFGYDDSGNVISVTDSRERTVTLGGI